MAITKEKKKEIIAGLEKMLSKSKSIVFVNFHKLLVKEASLIRRSLKSENVGYVVAKKSLFKRVLNSAGIKGDAPTLNGELAVVFGEDVIAPARAIYDFQKKLLGKVSIMGGIFDGEYRSQEEMLGMASIPSLEVLRGMFVNVLNSPIQRFAMALGQIAEKK
ncbi:MAG: 50S ribosomal protein L10 [Candidatus Zambryskibacteria bacterium RIFCSPLOWO2_01_FULL_39_39]|uniref:Large ribosomal subunit protein uL10 n=1 Tax=Candidatus Zambryskibacteria bacterium RIFCSPLOWO2_01_FULL_39_39 TaxID=1802758 RepID=A0A1G2TY62_9BACT|nr:MAG: 50S ribosomal protein L10 [Parcubacteria group bacterium GW2011_GWA1_38_7]OHA86921.1 MAG: 50S ribosomal protein L10 [Candidatus Zambryskibacteria bacterium RIFCSPHIGHO2_01_FULL_39_63]OHA94486.1 MAG: 50S ribosomal protein L10 [Candidatus Zambryskibacteria bacterium RIFCSPHIGHO2_02_FULL_39_19]OHA99017.1 MAG: 50S ribosomal protein L10 [Candidatus Zambryskibacteria bacterium RIFCSPHIGHO2_12_FULL_39_21]OHB01560.1 MAG: 50S ribosomal protein L10 [Candidatus Zambryskibacteria bacterium RIFCSPLO